MSRILLLLADTHGGSDVDLVASRKSRKRANLTYYKEKEESNE